MCFTFPLFSCIHQFDNEKAIQVKEQIIFLNFQYIDKVFFTTEENAQSIIESGV